jgi:Carbohydrate esterase, sialic acid-specific acetylesterase
MDMLARSSAGVLLFAVTLGAHAACQGLPVAAITEPEVDASLGASPDAQQEPDAAEQPDAARQDPDAALRIDADTRDGSSDVDAAIAKTDADAKVDASAPGPLAFVFAGESNSGGIAQNSEALPSELVVRPQVKIMNLYSGTFAFEDLKVGFNNLVDHFGLSTNPLYVPAPPNGILAHGMELGLANAVEGSAFPGVSSVYLVKTGQGGSRIAQWDLGSAYWAKFLERTNAAKAALPASTRWIVWYSQGINDAIDGLPIATWKAATIAHLGKVKMQLPGCQIIMTEFQSMPANGGYPLVNQAIQEIVAADPTLASVSSAGAATDGGNHWSYAGFRNMLVPALVAKSKL